MNSKIAFKGSKFIIEWYEDHKGYSQAFEYFNESSESQQDKLLALFRYMAENGKIFDETKFRNEGDGLYVFKPKKSQKMPTREKERALTAYKNYIKRVLEGVYYGREEKS